MHHGITLQERAGSCLPPAGRSPAPQRHKRMFGMVTVCSYAMYLCHVIPVRNLCPALSLLLRQVSWGVVPVEAILCYLLLGIDEIAIQMEEPFGEWRGR